MTTTSTPIPFSLENNFQQPLSPIKVTLTKPNITTPSNHLPQLTHHITHIQHSPPLIPHNFFILKPTLQPKPKTYTMSKLGRSSTYSLPSQSSFTHSRYNSLTPLHGLHPCHRLLFCCIPPALTIPPPSLSTSPPASCWPPLSGISVEHNNPTSHANISTPS